MYRSLIIFSLGLVLVFASRVAMAGPQSPEPVDQQENVLVIPHLDSDNADVILANRGYYYRPPVRYSYRPAVRYSYRPPVRYSYRPPVRYSYRPPVRYYGPYYRPYVYRPYGPYYGPNYGPGVYYRGPYVTLRLGY